jgi:hypothetical protein
MDFVAWHHLLESCDVVAVKVGGFVVQRVVGVRLVKQVNQPVNHLRTPKEELPWRVGGLGERERLRGGKGGEGDSVRRRYGAAVKPLKRVERRTHRVDVEHGLPVFAQNVEAHVALEVNVRVVNGRVAEHLVAQARRRGAKMRRAGREEEEEEEEESARAKHGHVMEKKRARRESQTKLQGASEPPAAAPSGTKKTL